MSYALIFPGQGAQKPGMGKEFYYNYSASRSVFDEVNEALGFSLSDVIFNGTEEDLVKTAITQPAILTVSMAVLRGIEAELGHRLFPSCVAGHSVGEYTSLVASGVISLADGVRLVRLRGSLMQDAVPLGVGSMLAIIGLRLDDVRKICKEAAEDEVCEVANINSATQIVVSGHTGALRRASATVEKAGGGKVIELRVSAPFHCSLMLAAAEKLKEAFADVKWHEPEFPIVTNVDAKFTTSIKEIKSALYRQTFSPVRWFQSVEAMQAAGVTGYIELGPGNVLSGLVKKICKGKRPYPVSEPCEVVQAMEFLEGEENA